MEWKTYFEYALRGSVFHGPVFLMGSLFVQEELIVSSRSLPLVSVKRKHRGEDTIIVAALRKNRIPGIRSY